VNSQARATGSWLTFLHLDGRKLWMFLGLCAGLALLEAFGDAGRDLLRYERDAIAAGEWWRLLSGHVVHLGWRHLALNVAGLSLMWALFFPDYTPARWGVILLVSALAIDIAFLAIERQIDWYVGLSGALHGVMVAGTVAHVRRRERDAFILAPFLVIKLAWEQLSGAMPYSSDPGGNVIVDAHLYGALGGLIASLVFFRRTVAQPML
jgi:rhomboid family GlyGly-CTERM serine protease